MNLRGRAGVTLVEIMMAGLLLSVVFLGAASAYISALRFFNALREKSGQVYSFYAVEHIARRARQANQIIVNSGGAANANTGKHVKLRWDYSEAGAALNTPDNTADDTWVKYAVLENPTGTWRLYWRTDSAATGAVTDAATTDPRLEESLLLQSGSVFNLASPSGPAEGRRVILDIHLETVTGTPPQTLTVDTDVMTGAYEKR